MNFVGMLIFVIFVRQSYAKGAVSLTWCLHNLKLQIGIVEEGCRWLDLVTGGLLKRAISFCFI